MPPKGATKYGPTCLVDGCERERYVHGGRGHCAAHYRRLRTHGDVRASDPIQVYQVVPASRSPTLMDIAWAAGFIEGEGCFTTHGQVTVTQKTIEPLARLQEFVGGGISQDKDGIYQLRLSGARARGLAMTLYPLLSSRRQKRIREMLAR